MLSNKHSLAPALVSQETSKKFSHRTQKRRPGTAEHRFESWLTSGWSKNLATFSLRANGPKGYIQSWQGQNFLQTVAYFSHNQSHKYCNASAIYFKTQYFD